MAIDPQPPTGAPPPWDGRPYPQQYGYQPYSAQPYSAQPYSAQPYSAQPYAYQPYPQQYASVAPTSGLAIASLICSIAGLFTVGLLAIAGIICGHMALGETRTGQREGHGLAVAGLVIGWIQIGLGLLFLFFFVIVLGVAAV